MTTRSLPLYAVVGAALIGMAPVVSAAETASTTVVVSAQFSSRTTLNVSTDVLRFDVENPADAATAVVDFSAAARTRAGAEVLLSVEQVRGEGPGGASDAEAFVSFKGQGSGTFDGTLGSAFPVLAGRWLGSGLRRGRLMFALHAGASGTYTIPVRFVLSAP